MEILKNKKNFFSLKDQDFLKTVIIPIIIAWLILFFFGYPNPNADDLFFIGAPINLAENGKLLNPLLRFWHERGHDRYFLHPPFYAYTLGAWLGIWGVSANSIIFFQCLCNILTSLCSALILRKYQFPKLTIYLVTVMYMTGGLNIGVRYDTLGITFLLIGTWFLINDNVWRYFGGFCFLGFGILTSPVVMTYAIPFAGALVLKNFLVLNQFSKSYILKRINSLILAFIFTFTLFLIFINFQLTQFLDDISWHATISGRVWLLGALIYIWEYLNRNNNMIFLGIPYLFYFCLLILCFIQRKNLNNSLKWFVITINIAMFFNIAIYVQGGIYVIWVWITMILIVTRINLAKKSLNTFLLIFLIILYFFFQTFTIISILGQKSISKDKYAQIRNEVNQMTDKTIFVDEVAARYVFDYRLPKGAINWGASNPPPFVFPTSIKDKKADQVWVISPVKSNIVKDLSIDYPHVKIFGHTFNSIPQSPYDVIIVK